MFFTKLKTIRVILLTFDKTSKIHTDFFVPFFTLVLTHRIRPPPHDVSIISITTLPPRKACASSHMLALTSCLSAHTGIKVRVYASRVPVTPLLAFLRLPRIKLGG